MKPELEFLPAALEIQATPPLPISRYILWAIILFFIFTVVWASIGEVDIVGVAQGKIIPSGKIKIIQPLETGVVRSILVKEGERVEAGQPLIELDTTLAGADHLSIKEQQLVFKLDRVRQLTILNTLNKDQTSIDHFNGLSEATPEQIRLQKERARSSLNEYQAKIGALKDEQRQRQAERNAVDQRIQQLDATLPLITERAKSLEEMAKKNMLPRVQWLELEQERIEQVKERDVQKNNLDSLGAAIANINQRLAAQKAEFESQILTELADAENRIAAFEQEKVKAKKRVTLQKLIAPVSGKVHQLAVHTIGGVVTPAQELMHIVPDEDAVEVEAWLPNKDIGFVHEGQAAEIKVETFPFTKYGVIEAEILNVSNDATPDEYLGLVYAMRVKMHKTIMKVEEKMINLSPGMAVTVEVNLGKRRLIEYLLSPLLRYKDESVRER
ncbi:MAG TPA: HlyD family type I secretion periplasmic adaptor subunit [Chryseolinea sp.]|nr:HlyD family type I secretion periplasmic adaptor subunit [Chryseolinea sp.]